MIIIALLAEGQGILKLFRTAVKAIVTPTNPPPTPAHRHPPPTQTNSSPDIFSEGIIHVDQN